MTAAAHDPVAAQIEAEVAQLIRQRQEHEVLFYSWREPYKSRVAAVQAQVRASAARATRAPTRARARLVLAVSAPVALSDWRAQRRLPTPVPAV